MKGKKILGWEWMLFLLSLTYRLFRSNGTSKADARTLHKKTHLPELLSVTSHIHAFRAFSGNAASVRHIGKLGCFGARKSFNTSSQRSILNAAFARASCRLRSVMAELAVPKLTSRCIVPRIILQNAGLKPYPAANACRLITPILLD